MKPGAWTAVVLLFLAPIGACDSDDAADDEPTEAGEGADEAEAEGLTGEVLGRLGVVAESGSDDMVRIEQSDEHYIEFCYLGGECEASGARAAASTIGGQGVTSVLDTSAADRDVVGARVRLEVEGDGEAVVIVGEGILHVDDEGVVPDEEFEFDEILETTDPLTGGDTVSIEIGETD